MIVASLTDSISHRDSNNTFNLITGICATFMWFEISWWTVIPTMEEDRNVSRQQRDGDAVAPINTEYQKKKEEKNVT